MIFDVDGDRATTIAALLEAAGLTVDRCLDAAEAPEALRCVRPSLVVIVVDAGPTRFLGLRETARSFGIPTLAVIDPGGGADSLADRVRPYDGWVALSRVASELGARAAGLMAGGVGGQGPVVDPRFLGLIVHDLRTPLNVIGLTIRAISQSMPQRSAELDEDLTFLHENARQIEMMLAQLGDYCRLLEAESPVSGLDFEPRRFLSDFLEDRQSRPGAEATPIRLDIADDSPAEVSLDPNRARLALQHALANAIAAAAGGPVRLRSRGPAGRWVIEMVVEKSPPPTVTTAQLRPGLFERLAGSAAERRGLDLAIAARVSELFGGTARLEIEPGVRSRVVLDWPDRLARP